MKLRLLLVILCLHNHLLPYHAYISMPTWPNDSHSVIHTIPINPSRPTHIVYQNGPMSLRYGATRNRYYDAQPQQYHFDYKKFSKKYSQWTSGDFKKEAYTNSEMLAAYHMYQFKGYRDFIKTLPDYEEFITSLHQQLQGNDPNVTAVTEQLSSHYNTNLKQIVTTLSNEINQKKRSQARIAHKKEKVLAQQAYQEKCTAIQKNLQISTPHIKESIANSHLVIEQISLPEHTRSRSIDRYNARAQALNTSEQNNFALVNKSYALSQNTQSFLRESSIDQNILTQCLGSTLQQQMHHDITDLFDQTASLYYETNQNKPLQSLTKNIGQLAEVATEYNTAGHVHHSITFSDCGWALLDVVLGVKDGLRDIAGDVGSLFYKAYNYDETLNDIREGTYAFINRASYHLGSLLHTVADLSADYYDHPDNLIADLQSITDPEQIHQRLQKVEFVINAVVDVIDKKIQETSLRETSRFITHHGIKIWFTDKGLKKGLTVVSSIYKEAQLTLATAMHLIKEGVQPPLALAGLESIYISSESIKCARTLAQSTNDLPLKSRLLAALGSQGAKHIVSTNPSSTPPTNPPIHTPTPTHIPFHDEIDLLKNKYNHICELDGKKLHFNFEHIFEGEISKKGKFGGFHHDYLGHAKNNGIKKLKNIKKFKHGFYEAYVLDNKGEWVYKSFFPDSWSRDKVMKKTVALLDKIKLKKGRLTFTNSPLQRITFDEFLPEGIKIKIVVDRCGKIVTAYPVF